MHMASSIVYDQRRAPFVAALQVCKPVPWSPFPPELPRGRSGVADHGERMMGISPHMKSATRQSAYSKACVSKHRNLFLAFFNTKERLQTQRSGAATCLRSSALLIPRSAVPAAKFGQGVPPSTLTPWSNPLHG